MQAYWNRFAFLRLVLMMMGGILLSYLFDNAFWLSVSIFFGGFLAYLLLLFYNPQFLKQTKSVFSGALAFLLCASIGYLNTYLQAERFDENHLLNIDTTVVEAFTAVLNSKGKETAKSYGFEANISAVKVKGEWQRLTGKTMLYLEKSKKTAAYQYGDELLFASGIQMVLPTKNPNEFDYKAYMAISQIYFQQYITVNKIHLLQVKQGNALMAMSYQASEYLSQLLQKYIQDEQSYAIANALTLGIKDDLDNELKTAYAAAGAMHVLAVSGLHVGIIFMIVAFAFKNWRNQIWGRWVYAVTSLAVLWSFAFITGLSPSVMRAATMFSFVVIAQASRRHTNIYNTLAASAFLLLLIDPYLLFSVGFQLSYLAVFGIVYFQPKIQMLLPIKNKWLDKLWILTSVSISAQLVTAPLGMLYFHQFPSYFFLSNIIVIPAAFVILNGSLLLMLTSVWPPLAGSLGEALNVFIQLMNKSIFWLEQLPFSTIEGIYFTSIEVLLMYIILILGAIFITQKSFNYWLALFMCLAGLSTSVIYRQNEAAKVEKLIIHAVPKVNTISYIKGGEAFIYTSHGQSDSTSLNYHVMPYVQASGVKLATIDTSFSKFPLKKADWRGLSILEWHEKSIVHMQQAVDLGYKNKQPTLNVDYLILSNNVWQESSVIFELFSPQLVIIDGSNSYYRIRQMQAWLDKMEINYYTVPELGAFEFKI